jgi:seryl-tRNA synthetase
MEVPAMERRKLSAEDQVKAMRARREKVKQAEELRAAALERSKRKGQRAKVVSGSVAESVEGVEVVSDTVAEVSSDQAARMVDLPKLTPWIDQMVARVVICLRNGQVERAVELCREVEHKGVDYDPQRDQRLELDTMLCDVFGQVADVLARRGIMTVRQLLSLTRDQLFGLDNIGPVVGKRIVEILERQFTESHGRLLNYPAGYRSREVMPLGHKPRVNRKFNRWD